MQARHHDGGQRIINQTCVQEEGWVLFSFDVSVAFAKGMTFEEYAKLTGEPLRVVQFELTREDAVTLQKIPGFETFDPDTEVLLMVKAVYGLKDAPRAWHTKLHMILTQFEMNSLYADPQLYVKHLNNKLKMILSAHVDDLKGGAPREEAMRLLKHLEAHVVNCTQQWGILHTW